MAPPRAVDGGSVGPGMTPRGSEKHTRPRQKVGLPAQTIEDSADLRSLRVAAQRRTLLRALAVMWFHSSTDGDGRLQRLRRGTCRPLTIGWLCLRWIVAA